MNLQVQVFRGDIECRMIRKDKKIREDKKKEERRNEYSEMYLKRWRMNRVGREGKARGWKENEELKRINRQTQASQAKPSHSQWEGRRRKTDEDSKAEEMKGKLFYL